MRVTGTPVLIEESDFNYKYAVFKDEIGGYYYSDWNYKEDMDNRILNLTRVFMTRTNLIIVS